MAHGILSLCDFSVVQTKLIGQLFDSEFLLLEQDLVVVRPVSPKERNFQAGILLGALLDNLLGKGQPGGEASTASKSFAFGSFILVVARQQSHCATLGEAPDDDLVGWNTVFLLELGDLLFDLFDALHQSRWVVLAAHPDGPIKKVEPTGHGHSPVDGDGDRRRCGKDVFDVAEVGLEAREAILEVAPSPGCVTEAVEKDQRPAVGCLGSHGQNAMVAASVGGADKEYDE